MLGLCCPGFFFCLVFAFSWEKPDPRPRRPLRVALTGQVGLVTFGHETWDSLYEAHNLISQEG